MSPQRSSRFRFPRLRWTRTDASVVAEASSAEPSVKRVPRRYFGAFLALTLLVFGLTVLPALLAMLGLDDDTPEDFDRTLEFLIENKVALAKFHLPLPYPGTRFYERMERDGRILTRDWDEYHYGNAVIRPLKMSPEAAVTKYWATYRTSSPCGPSSGASCPQPGAISTSPCTISRPTSLSGSSNAPALTRISSRTSSGSRPIRNSAPRALPEAGEAGESAAWLRGPALPPEGVRGSPKQKGGRVASPAP